MKLMLIEWEDSSGHSGWHNPNQTNHRTLYCSTIGYVIEGKKDTICLAQSICENGDVDHVISIPNVCIRKRRILRHK